MKIKAGAPGILKSNVYLVVFTRDENSNLFSSDPDPAQLEKKNGSGSGSDLHLKWKKVYLLITVCPGSIDPFYIVSCYIKRVTTSWTYSM